MEKFDIAADPDLLLWNSISAKLTDSQRGSKQDLPKILPFLPTLDKFATFSPRARNICLDLILSSLPVLETVAWI